MDYIYIYRIINISKTVIPSFGDSSRLAPRSPLLILYFLKCLMHAHSFIYNIHIDYVHTANSRLNFLLNSRLWNQNKKNKNRLWNQPIGWLVSLEYLKDSLTPTYPKPLSESSLSQIPKLSTLPEYLHCLIMSHLLSSYIYIYIHTYIWKYIYVYAICIYICIYMYVCDMYMYVICICHIYIFPRSICFTL